MLVLKEYKFIRIMLVKLGFIGQWQNLITKSFVLQSSFWVVVVQTLRFISSSVFNVCSNRFRMHAGLEYMPCITYRLFITSIKLIISEWIIKLNSKLFCYSCPSPWTGKYCQIQSIDPILSKWNVFVKFIKCLRIWWNEKSTQFIGLYWNIRLWPSKWICQNLITNYIFTTPINIFMTPINIHIATLSLVNLTNSNILNKNSKLPFRSILVIRDVSSWIFIGWRHSDSAIFENFRTMLKKTCRDREKGHIVYR